MTDPSSIDDLFGDDDAPAERAPIEHRGSGTSRGLPSAPRLVWALGAVLLIGLFWYLSDAHHDRFYIKVDEGVARVERGLFLPFGASEWRPSRAYGAVKLPPGIEPERTGAMTAEEVDQILLKLFVDIARQQLQDLEKGRPDIAEDMLLRAGKLGNITMADDRRLLEMMGDVAFRRGLTEIRGIQQRFDEALRQFRLAAQRGGVTYKGAERWARAIDRLNMEFRQLSRDSGLDPDAILANPTLALPSFGKAKSETDKKRADKKSAGGTDDGADQRGEAAPAPR